MHDTIAVAIIVSLMGIFVLMMDYVSLLLLHGYFITGVVCGIASGAKDLVGGIFFGACGVVVSILAIKMVKVC